MYEKLKEECYAANMELPVLELVLYTFGNVSCADREAGVFAIKPSGVAYDDLRPENMVVVAFSGQIVEGDLRPSSDTPTHAYLYRAWKEIGGIVHTHSTFATGWAQALRDIPIYGTTHADHLPTPVPCTPLMADDRVENDYEAETGRQIVDCFAARGLAPTVQQMALVGGHGPFAWGATAAKAVYSARVLEELAKMAFITETVNPRAQLLKPSIINKHYLRKHGKDAYYGQQH